MTYWLSCQLEREKLVHKRANQGDGLTMHGGVVAPEPYTCTSTSGSPRQLKPHDARLFWPVHAQEWPGDFSLLHPTDLSVKGATAKWDASSDSSSPKILPSIDIAERQSSIPKPPSHSANAPKLCLPVSVSGVSASQVYQGSFGGGQREEASAGRHRTRNSKEAVSLSLRSGSLRGPRSSSARSDMIRVLEAHSAADSSNQIALRRNRRRSMSKPPTSRNVR